MRPGCIVAFLGPDGAGKSTVIGLLARELEARGIPWRGFHWVVPWRLGGSSQVVTDPHARPPRGRLASLLKLAWLLVQAWPAWALRVFPARRRGEWVILDRCFLDLLCDPRRYRYGGPSWAARLVACLMPHPDRLVVLHAPEAVILARKREVEADELRRQLGAYRGLGRRRGAILLDASPAPPAIIAELRSALALGEAGA